MLAVILLLFLLSLLCNVDINYAAKAVGGRNEVRNYHLTAEVGKILLGNHYGDILTCGSDIHTGAVCELTVESLNGDNVSARGGDGKGNLGGSLCLYENVGVPVNAKLGIVSNLGSGLLCAVNERNGVGACGIVLNGIVVIVYVNDNDLACLEVYELVEIVVIIVNNVKSVGNDLVPACLGSGNDVVSTIKSRVIISEGEGLFSTNDQRLKLCLESTGNGYGNVLDSLVNCNVEGEGLTCK